MTELIMKDPAPDFFLKHQPLEYYKCHLQAVLEKGEGRGLAEMRVGREADTIVGLNGTQGMRQKLLDWTRRLYLSGPMAEVCDGFHYGAN